MATLAVGKFAACGKPSFHRAAPTSRTDRCRKGYVHRKQPTFILMIDIDSTQYMAYPIPARQLVRT